jgi:hypothetical protein
MYIWRERERERERERQREREMGSCYDAQTGLKLLDSSDPLTSASK